MGKKPSTDLLLSPDEIQYQLTRQEFAGLMSQSVISKGDRGGRRKLPWAFTERCWGGPCGRKRNGEST